MNQANSTIVETVKHFGEYSQIVVAIEELAELQQQLTKVLRGKTDYEHITEEMADVQIILAELEVIFRQHISPNDVKEVIKYKLDRISKRIRDPEYSENYLLTFERGKSTLNDAHDVVG